MSRRTLDCIGFFICTTIVAALIGGLLGYHRYGCAAEPDQQTGNICYMISVDNAGYIHPSTHPHTKGQYFYLVDTKQVMYGSQSTAPDYCYMVNVFWENKVLYYDPTTECCYVYED